MFLKDKGQWSLNFLTEDSSYLAIYAIDSNHSIAFQPFGNGFVSQFIDNTLHYWLEINLQTNTRRIAEVYIHKFIGSPYFQSLFKGMEVRVGNDLASVGQPTMFTHNTFCNSGPTTNIEESYYIYPCQNGPIQGQYVTIQSTEKNPLAISEVNIKVHSLEGEH